ncbi:MAG TPA: hypothetical protein VMW82_01425 [Candidatus Paceibacterota bacterium]|nr:hypothetical protein [Candidatus Paceibacterota bacterium]
MKKILTFIIVIVVIAGMGYFAFYRPQPSNNNQPIGGDRDEHDCIGSAGYSWCETKQKCLRVFEEFCSDQVADLVDVVRQVSGINLAVKGETNFDWIVFDGTTRADKSISGILYQVDDIKRADYDKIEKFFNDNYKIDINNIADGVAGGLRGYSINYMACILNFRHNQLKENENAPTEIVGDSLNVKLECGYFNPNDVAKILIEQKIKEILAAKYDKKVTDVMFNITRSDDTHVVGNVFFLIDGEQGEGGGVLAIKNQDEWKLVYDGNGSVDCQLLKNTYKFSDDLLINYCD